MANFLATSGQGEDWWGDEWYCPDFYPPIRAARYLSVPPWEMLEPATAQKIPRYWWLVWSSICENAEARAKKLFKDHKA